MAEGAAASTVRNAVLPLRAIYRRAVSRSEVHLNPTEGLTLPAVRGRRDRVARPSEASALLEAAPVADRAVWATALYAGLRRGELAALRWADVDLERGLIRVERSWDPKAGPVEPKSRSGRRRVPLARPLRVHLAAHRLLLGRSDDAELLFGRSGGGPCTPTCSRGGRTRPGGERASSRSASTSARHTYAAFMIAAGVNAKALDLHGPFLDHDHPRPLRAPHARERGAGGADADRLPRSGGWSVMRSPLSLRGTGLQNRRFQVRVLGAPLRQREARVGKSAAHAHFRARRA